MMRTEICWLMRRHQVLGGYWVLHAVVLVGHSSAPRWGKAAELHFGFGISLGWSGDEFGMATSASWLPDHHVSGFQCWLASGKLAARSRCFWLPVQAGCQIIMFLATSASWLPDHHVSGYQCKLAARSSCFWLPVQAGCQVTMFLATSASWLPGHDISGYQCKLTARSSCFWLPVQAGCQIIMFLATSASWLPGHDVSCYQCKLAARSSCFWLSVQFGCQIIFFWLPVQTEKVVRGGWRILVGFWQHCCQGGQSSEEPNQSFRDWGWVRCSMWWNS